MITRRFALVSAVSFCFGALTVVSCSKLSSKNWTDKEFLIRFVELQVPLNVSSLKAYSDIASKLIESAHSDPVLTEAIFDMAKILRENDWLDQSETNQLRQIRDLEEESWFSLIGFRARAAFFEHPDIWKLIEYEGSSIENGGYIDNGFDDISWLPVISQ